MSLVVILALMLLTAAPPTRAATGEQRALQRAAERMQARVEARLVLWEDHSTWDRAWRVSSEHYDVRTVESYRTARDLGRRADAAAARLGSLLGVERPPPGRASIYLLPDLAAYNAFGGDHGADHSSFYGSFLASEGAGLPQPVVAALSTSNRNLRRMWVLHSVVHQYVGQAFPGGSAPTWIEEGLASYLGLFDNFGWARSEFARLSAAGAPAFLSVADLVGTPLEGYGDRTDARMLELGMLFAYLLDYRDDTRSRGSGAEHEVGPFERYVRAAVRGEAGAGDPIARFVREAPAELEDAWRAFDGW